MTVGVRELRERHPADQRRLSGARRARHDQKALAHAEVRQNARFDILLFERRRQILDGPNDRMGADPLARHRSRDIDAKSQHLPSRHADHVHDVDVLTSLQPRHPVGAIEVIDDQARVALVQGRAGLTL